jgi:lysophospholipase L1-like esterase
MFLVCRKLIDSLRSQKSGTWNPKSQNSAHLESRRSAEPVSTAQIRSGRAAIAIAAFIVPRLSPARWFLCLFAVLAFPVAAWAQPGRDAKWVTVWTGSVQGPYPVGNATAQPELRFAFLSDKTGASDQSFRLIVRPDLWGRRARLRFSNAFGTQPVALDDIHVGLQNSGSALVPGTNRAVSFGGHPGVTLQPGGSAWSDPVDLGLAADPAARELTGRKLAVSFHVAGESGPMTWHAKALTTSFVSPPRSGAHGAEEGEASFPFSTTSWYFLDALDMTAAAETGVVVAYGDSITDGTASTLNGDDRWPDVLSRRLHSAQGERFVVVNEGIGGNQVAGPTEYSPAQPFAGGPSATDRLERDVLGLSGVSAVIWMEGINDFGAAKATAETVESAMQKVVRQLREQVPGVRIIGATLTSSLHSTIGEYGATEVEQKRQALNQFIRSDRLFDGVADFDKTTTDPQTGELKSEYQPNSTTGGPGDKLHPNRAGYAAMGFALDLELLAPQGRRGAPLKAEGR